MKLIISGAKLGVVVGSAYVVFSIIGGVWTALLRNFNAGKKKGDTDVKEEGQE